jgi:general stress protein 26
VRALWSEGFQVWFPDGPDSPNIALLAVDVEVAKAAHFHFCKSNEAYELLKRPRASLRRLR